MTDEIVLEHKIMTKKRFSMAVAELVAKQPRQTMSYIDAAVFIIEQRGMEYSNLKRLLSDSLLAKIENEAQQLNLIKLKGGNSLPL